MPLDSWTKSPFWNRPDNLSKQSWPWCRAILNEVMDMKSFEISLVELDTFLDIIDSREWIRWRVAHFLSKNIPYRDSFSYIWCSEWGVLLRDDTTWDFFVVEIINDTFYKTFLPNSWQSTWSDLWDVRSFEYIDLWFMFHVDTWCDREARRKIFFNQARNWFAGRKKKL